MARTGRPREFDTTAALDAAMRLFWQHGYEATSFSALREATGLSSASLYAAFGSKHGLFDAVLARYNATFGTVTDIVAVSDQPPREAVENMLRRSAAMQTDPTHPAGCLVVLAGTACAPGNERVPAVLAERRASVRAALRACVVRAVDSGELGADTDVDGLTAVVESFMWGLSTQARDAIAPERLDRAVDQVMRLWDLQRPVPSCSAGPHPGGPTPSP